MGLEYLEKKRRKSCLRTLVLAACVGIIFGLTAIAIIKTDKSETLERQLKIFLFLKNDKVTDKNFATASSQTTFLIYFLS